MNTSNGYVKIYRSIEQWEWYRNVNTFKLFLHCLIRANHKANKWQGITIEAGSFVSSIKHLSAETGLSEKQVRTSINHLKSTQELAQRTTHRFSVFTVVKWADYQGTDDDMGTVSGAVAGTLGAQYGHTKGTLRATNKNEKNDKNEKNKDLKSVYGDDNATTTHTKSSFGEFGHVKLTQEEHNKINEFGLESYIEKLDSYKASTGKKYKSDYATILNWARKDGHETTPQKKGIEQIKGKGTIIY